MRIQKFVLTMLAVFGATGYVHANMALETPEVLLSESGPDYWYGAEGGPAVLGADMQQGPEAGALADLGDLPEGSDELAAALEVEDVKVPEFPREDVTADEEADGEEIETEDEVDREYRASEEARPKERVSETVDGVKEDEVSESGTADEKKEMAQDGQESGIEAVIKKEIAEKLDEVTEALSPIINRWVDELGKHIKKAIKQWASTIQELVAEETAAAQKSTEDES